MSFNYFGALSHVQTYSKFRPCPPAKLVTTIINFLQEEISGPLMQAVDVGCGSGQSTTILAPFFKNVVGLDPSPDIIDKANSLNKIENTTYSVSHAEKTPLKNNSVDLVTTVQAIHWFDKPAFYAEVNRILKKKGVLAVYGYNLPEVIGKDGSTAASSLIRKYYEEVLREYVLPGSRQVYLRNYRDPEFNEVPFVEGGIMTRQEGFTTTMDVTVADVVGYISSWSGFQNFAKQKGESAGEELLRNFENELMKVLGNGREEIISVRYNYFILLGRKI